MSDWLYAEYSGTTFLIASLSDGIFLYTIYPNGESGDTWHRNFEDAKHQATFEAGSIVGPWQAVSVEFVDTLRERTRLIGKP